MSGTARRALGLFLLVFALTFLAARSDADETVVKVGGDKISEADLLFLIGGGEDAMQTGLALVQMDMKAREELVNRVADQVLLALAARERKMHLKPEVARMLRWQEVQKLAGVYLAEVGASWDLGEPAAKKYYDEHPDEFIQAEAVKIKYIALPRNANSAEVLVALKAGTDFAQVSAKYGDRSVPLDGAAESGWLEKGLVRKEFEGAFFSSKTVGLLEPIETDVNTYVVEITSRRESELLPWDEARDEARQRLERALFKNEIEKLKKSHPVLVDEKALRNLGGAEAK